MVEEPVQCRTHRLRGPPERLVARELDEQTVTLVARECRRNRQPVGVGRPRRDHHLLRVDAVGRRYLFLDGGPGGRVVELLQ
jgi:hypothetical protein